MEGFDFACTADDAIENACNVCIRSPAQPVEYGASQL